MLIINQVGVQFDFFLVVLDLSKYFCIGISSARHDLSAWSKKIFASENKALTILSRSQLTKYRAEL